MQPYRDPDRPNRAEDGDPVLFEQIRRVQIRSGMIPCLGSDSLGCLIVLVALAVVGLLVLWGLQSLGIYVP